MALVVYNSRRTSPGEGIERHHLAPGSSPAWGNGVVFAAPGAFLKGGQSGLCSFGVHSAVDVFQSRGHGFAILVGHELQAVPEKMDNAGLNHGFWEDGRDRLGKT